MVNLALDGGEEAEIRLVPVEHPALQADHLGHHAARLGKRRAFLEENLDGRDFVAEVEQPLRVGHRRIDEVGVVIVHAGTEDRGDGGRGKSHANGPGSATFCGVGTGPRSACVLISTTCITSPNAGY